MEVRRLQAGDHALLASAIRVLLTERVASDAHLKLALDDPACYFILCIEDGAPFGYLSAYRFPAIDAVRFLIYLYDLVVDASHRRRRLGSRMVEELKKQCAGDEIANIWAGTSLENIAARKTFEGTGARKVGEAYVEYVYPCD